MRMIDLNADLGEGGTQDARLLSLVSSANIACGGHAGNERTMREAITAALVRGVAPGAHPGYEDREHFGRRNLDLAPASVADLVSRQIELFAKLTAELGAEAHHVKPHGALYTQAALDPDLAGAVAAGVKRVIPGCLIYVPASGALARAAVCAGLAIRLEGFVDRRYLPDGQLVPRSEPGALITDSGEACSQALAIACHHRVRSSAGSLLSLSAETLCVHGDAPHAVELLEAVRGALESAGFEIKARSPQ